MSVSVALDVDPGLDDAFALMLALRSPEVRLELVTTVAGNGPIDMTTRNACRVLHHLDAGRVPVARGAAAPLRRVFRGALAFHGADALGCVPLPDATTGLHDRPAPEALFRFAAAAPGERYLVTTGPLTNLALALQAHPELARMLREVVVMGGAFGLTRHGHGNVTPTAEFNIWQDPDAAAIVFSSGARLTIVGLDVTNDPSASLDASDLERLRSGTSPCARLAAGILEFALGRNPLFALHDPLALGVLLDRSLFSFVAGRARVETSDDEQGRTTLLPGASTTSVASAVDGPRFKHKVLSRLLKE